VASAGERAELAARHREGARMERAEAVADQKPRLDMVPGTPAPWPPAKR
jgi:hypothetical protein